MKTSMPAFRALMFSALVWGVTGNLSAQVSYTYTAPPPPGYPASGAPKQTVSTRSTRQSAATVQTPVTYPAYPGTYPPPPGYTYPPPPVYGTTAPKPTSSKTTSKPATKSTSSSKKTSGPPPPPKVYGPTGDLSSQVAKIAESDRIQNMRLGELERDVSSIKRGGKSSGSRYDGGTDLAAHTTYVARPGDTLWRIATTHRVSVGEIQQLNRMTAEEVHVGQTLLIPSPHRLSSTTTASYTPSTPGGSSSSAPVSSSATYTVKKGDSLKAIAIRHKMTTATLASANRIKDPNKIFIGQRLKIPGKSSTLAPKSSTPASPSSTVAEKSESPDTVPLPGFGLTPAPAPAAVAPPTPPAAAPTPAPAPRPSSTDNHRGILAYRVDSSDTIESIANQFSTTPERIREMNRLDAAAKLKSGDEIMVPAMGAVSVSR